MPALIIGRRNDTTTYGFNFFTRSLPCIKKLHLLFYTKLSPEFNVEQVKGMGYKKIVPVDIFNLLDPIALAHWISGDGSVTDRGILLCTDSYSIVDVVRIINVLIIRYDIECTLRKRSKNPITGYRIYIRERSMVKLITIIKPYMVDSMLYKLHIN